VIPRRAIGRALATGLAIALSSAPALACNAVLGVTDLPTDQCGGATLPSECGVCLASLCCGQEVACAEDSQCTGNGGLYACANACSGDQGCLNACGQGYSSDTIATTNALLVCQAQCNSACGL